MVDRPGYVTWGRRGALASAWLYAACVVVQVFLAGLATFDPGDGPAHWADHVNFGQWIGTLTILLLIFAIAGRTPLIVIAFSALVFLLYGMQYPLANTDASNMAALHAVNALVMFWLSMNTGSRILALVRRDA